MEREQQRRQEQLARQRADRLRQEREQERERLQREEAVRAELHGQWLARQRGERKQQAGEEQRRQALLAQLQEERRRQRGEEAQRTQRREHRVARLEELRRQEGEAKRPEAPAAEPPARSEQQRNDRLEALRAARAGELGRQQRARQEHKENLVRLREEQRWQRQAEGAQGHHQQQLRAARLDELRRRQREAGATGERAQALREKELERRREQLPAPAAGQPHPPVSPPAARPSAPRPTAARPGALSPAPVEEEVALPWLSAQGSFLVDEDGHAVYLRGVTVVGFDTASPGPDQALADVLTLDDANLSALSGWGVNLIRLPFTSTTILFGNASLSARDILAGLDDLIAMVSAAGCYVLLALKPVAEGNGILPSDNDYLCWRNLAIRYQHESAVLYELFASTSVLADNWLGVGQGLIGTIRKEHTASVLFIGNGNATADVTGFPMRFATGDPIHNLVYTIQLTPRLLNTIDRPQLQALAQAYPVFVSQWSDSGADFGRSSELAADLIERYGMGWAAANWNADPRLIVNAAVHEFVPTRWGFIVQRALAQPMKPLLVAFGGEGSTTSQ